MKKIKDPVSLLTIILIVLLLSNASYGQSRKKNNGPTISIATSLNYYPTISPYTFFNSFNTQTNDQLILDFITSNSGTFTVDNGVNVAVERENITEFPSQTFGIGAGVRIETPAQIIHEVSLTKFSSSKSSRVISFVFKDTKDSIIGRTFRGYEQKSAAFAIRYEVGKVFGDNRNTLRFGLTGGVEPSYYSFRWNSISSNEFPTEANLFAVECSIIPSLTFKVAKKSFLDFKTGTYFFIADIGSRAEENNPILAPSMRGGEGDLKRPGLDWFFTLQFRHNIKEPKRKGRK